MTVAINAPDAPADVVAEAEAAIEVEGQDYERALIKALGGVSMADWQEDAHPRGHGGKFVHGSADKSTAAKSGVGDARINPMANPPMLMGGPPIPREELARYLSDHGQKWQAAPLPKDVARGEMGLCYQNATRLLMAHDGIDYCEGIAYNDKLGDNMGFMHAWGVTKDGKVVDPTWDHPESNRYFGVKYDEKKYLSHIMKTRYYGVLGNVGKNSEKVIKRGGL